MRLNRETQEQISEIAGGGSFLTASRDFTSAELKALNSSPINLINAPGTGKIIIPVFGTLQYIFGTTQYTGHAGIYLGDQDINFFNDTFISNSSSSFTIPFVGIVANPSQSFVNSPLKFYSYNTNMTSGDGTCKIKVYYLIDTLT